MTFAKLVGLGATLLLGIAALAQEYPRTSLSLDYSYVHFAPSQAYTQNKSLNGGGGAFVYHFTDHIGIKADLQGYNSFTDSFTIAPNPQVPGGAHGTVSGNLFTYLFGPEIRFRTQHFEYYPEVLIGAAHSNVYGSAFKSICQPVAGACSGVTSSPSNNGWAVMLGGGFDVPINHKVAIRVAELDYLLTRFGNFFTQANANQNSFRYTAGVVFNLGER